MEEEESTLTINKEYAAKYIKKKEHEERSILLEKYGDKAESSSSSSSEEEDEDAELITSDIEKDFLRTLSFLKSRDPSIYKSDTKFYSTVSGEGKGQKLVSAGHRPMHLKDYERQQLLEKGSKAGLSDSDGESEGAGQQTYSEEQERLREDFRAAVAADTAGECEDLLVLRQKTKEEKAKEEREYVQWLKGGGGGELAGRLASDLGGLRQHWADPALDSDEKFLRDYILHKGYLDTDDSTRIPSYDEVVGTDSAPSDSEDEEALEEQEIFERKYNFRFEEPDADLITSYPRTLEKSVRQEDDRRKVKRREHAERKAKEKQTRQEEVRRLRNLQEKALQEKLEKLAHITGNPVDSFGLKAEDLEEDFDPNTYDKTMQNVFNEEYYEGAEEEKPEFSDLEEEEGTYPYDEEDQGDVDFNMDAHNLPPATTSRKRKRQSKTNIDDLHNLQDKLKGELFCYREVEPNDFGLTTEEILWCDNKELNQWVSLSKAVQYLTPEEEQRERSRYLKKARNLKKKKAILTSCYGDDDDDGGASSSRKRRSKNKATAAGKGKKAAAKLRHKRKGMKLKGEEVSEARLKSYGI